MTRVMEPDRRRPSVTIRARDLVTALLLATLALGPLAPGPASAANAAKLEREARHALADLYAENAAARLMRDKARAILVFPRMVKAGFLFGGQIGEGALLRNGRAAGYYNSVAASYGFQAGAQVFGYALFFMTDSALEYLNKSQGFEVGVGPSVVVLNAGMAKSMTSTTLTQGVYALIFNQKGLMAGVGIQGSKITKISK
jgi:lipid-binding SYLF domain-containing protein